MIEKFFRKILLLCLFFFFPKAMQTDSPRYVDLKYSEYSDLGNGAAIAVQTQGYFIEDENGNTYYTEESKTQFIEKPVYLEGGSKVVYEESSNFDQFIPAEKPIESRNAEAKQDSQEKVFPTKKRSDTEKPIVNVEQERAASTAAWRDDMIDYFRDDCRETAARKANRAHNLAIARCLWNCFRHEFDEVPPNIDSTNSYKPEEKNSFLAKFSKFEYKDGQITLRHDYENLIQTFCREVIGKHIGVNVDWSTTKVSLQTLDWLEMMLATSKKLKRKALHRLELFFGKNYLKFFIDEYRSELKEKLELENFRKARVKERQKNEKLGKERAEKEKSIQERMSALSKKLSDKLIDTKQDLSKSEGFDSEFGVKHRDWLEAELNLQQQEGKIFLDGEMLNNFENLRSWLNQNNATEMSKTYLNMLNQAETERSQNDGKISKKLYNRLNAAEVARKNNFTQTKSTNILNNYAYQYVPQNMCATNLLEECSGNGIQHNVHGEIVGFVNRYSCYLYANNKDIGSDGPNLYEAANIALELKNKMGYSYQSSNSKIYERTYSFLDFCHNLLKVKVGETALYLVQRFGMGFEEGGADIQKVFKNGLSDCSHGGAFDGDNDLSNILEGKEDIDKVLMKHRESFESKQKQLDDLFQRVRNQPLDESVGDALQFLSRKLVQTSAIIVTTLGIVTAAEAGVVVATGVGGAVAAQKLLVPFVTNITDGGGVVLDKAVSSGVSVSQAVSVSLGLAAENLYGLSAAANDLCFAMQGDGGGSTEAPKKYFKDGPKEIDAKTGRVDEIPDKAYDTLDYVDKKGKAPDGYSGGGVYKNSGKYGGEILPEFDSARIPISYQEWDVNPLKAPKERGLERLITGSDGSAYYTNNHYDTFKRIR